MRLGDGTSAPIVPGLVQCPIRCRWALNCGAWDFSEGDKLFYLSLLTSEEQAVCTKFHCTEDQKRALASRILQRLLGSLLFDIPLQSVQISRTASGKPFLQEAHSGNVSYNVSHEV